MKNIAVILAGGKGTRFGNQIPKQFLKIHGKTVIEYSIAVFDECVGIDEIWVVVNLDYEDFVSNLAVKNEWTKVTKIIKGGSERHFSTLNAIAECTDEADINLIFHDAARPAVTERIVCDTVEALKKYEACAVAVAPKDTVLKVSADESVVAEVPLRSSFRMAQTPQAFRLQLIREAYRRAAVDGFAGITDDCGVICRYMPEAEIHIVEGDVRNIKLTTPVDEFALKEILGK